MENKTEELKALHKELWLWLAEQAEYIAPVGDYTSPNQIRALWPKWRLYKEKYPGAYRYLCFACQYAEDKSMGKDSRCLHCPINRDTLGTNCYISAPSLYTIWRSSKNVLELKTLAEVIAIMWD